MTKNELTINRKLIDLVLTLENIDINSKIAKLNEHTISDNNGGRIEL
jgi:hypothetical protein